MLFREIMSRALAQAPIVPFDIPMSVVEKPQKDESPEKPDKEPKKPAEHGKGHGKEKK
ncbi:hypothetical protein D3C85_1422400 [compost metagenome]